MLVGPGERTCEQRGAEPAVGVPRAGHRERFLFWQQEIAIVNFIIKSGILHLRSMRSAQNWVGFFWLHFILISNGTPKSTNGQISDLCLGR